MIKLLTHICVTWPQWVKSVSYITSSGLTACEKTTSLRYLMVCIRATFCPHSWNRKMESYLQPGTNAINSLAPGRGGCYFKSAIFNLVFYCLVSSDLFMTMPSDEWHRAWWVNIGSWWANVDPALGRHIASPGPNESIIFLSDFFLLNHL